MREFDVNRGYAPGRDVRRTHWAKWADKLQRGERPNGAFWALVGPRRSGKTWALAALEALIDRPGQVRRLELSDTDALAEPEQITETWLLLDEPGTLIADDARAFLDTCAGLKARARVVIVAMTPAEFCALRAVAPKHVQPRREFYEIPPIDSAAVARMARGVPWAMKVLAELPVGWSGSPYLIDLLLSIAESAPDPNALDIGQLCAETLLKARTGIDDYVYEVFHKGLDDVQRDMLRRIAAGEPGDTSDALHEAILSRCGLIRDGRIADPALARYLPPPLIIHHVSDVHVGHHSAATVDAKSTDIPPPGDPTVRDDYLRHIENAPQPPHLVIISGDILEWGADEEYTAALNWMQRLDALLAHQSHPDLPPDTPRILIAPGNHDVDRAAAAGPDGARKRHAKFAEAFDRWPRPHLEEDPETRGLTVVHLGHDLNIEVVLLGSAEHGQAHVRDPALAELARITEDLWAEVMKSVRAEQWTRYSALREKVEIIDPAVVHHADLARLKRRTNIDRVRIVALHHPVIPVPANPEIARYAGLLNAGAVRDALFESRTALVLHGHQHTGWIGREQWPARYGEQTLTIASAPTLGSSQTSEQNGYNVLCVIREDKTVRLSVTRVVRQGTGWRPGSPAIEVPLAGATPA